MKKTYEYKKIKSQVGKLKLVGSDEGLAAILWEKEKKGRVDFTIGKENKKLPIFLKTEKQLGEYFDGTRNKFDIQLDQSYGTPFQQKVWKELLKIPYGKTVSYAYIAKKIKSRNSYRAVGGAVGRNPLSIIAACHRVIGSSGKLTGFAGGLKNKEYLLNLEKSRKLLLFDIMI